MSVDIKNYLFLYNSCIKISLCWGHFTGWNCTFLYACPWNVWTNLIKCVIINTNFYVITKGCCCRLSLPSVLCQDLCWSNCAIPFFEKKQTCSPIYLSNNQSSQSLLSIYSISDSLSISFFFVLYLIIIIRNVVKHFVKFPCSRYVL